MKSMLIALFCGAALLLTGSAHAYAIYSHVDHEVCAQDKLSAGMGGCDFQISPNGKHNGAHGSGLKHYRMVWASGSNCRGSDFFDIPDGGYARIYNDVVKIYKHDGKHVGDKGVSRCQCPDPSPYGKKQ